MPDQTYTARTISTGVFASPGPDRRITDRDELVAFIVANTRQPVRTVEDSLPFLDSAGTLRVPANSMHGGAICVDVEVTR